MVLDRSLPPGKSPSAPQQNNGMPSVQYHTSRRPRMLETVLSPRVPDSSLLEHKPKPKSNRKVLEQTHPNPFRKKPLPTMSWAQKIAADDADAALAWQTQAQHDQKQAEIAKAELDHLLSIPDDSPCQKISLVGPQYESKKYARSYESATGCIPHSAKMAEASRDLFVCVAESKNLLKKMGKRKRLTKAEITMGKRLMRTFFRLSQERRTLDHAISVEQNAWTADLFELRLWRDQETTMARRSAELAGASDM